MTLGMIKLSRRREEKDSLRSFVKGKASLVLFLLGCMSCQESVPGQLRKIRLRAASPAFLSVRERDSIPVISDIIAANSGESAYV